MITKPDLIRLIEANAHSIQVTLKGRRRRMYVVDSRKLAEAILEEVKRLGEG